MSPTPSHLLRVEGVNLDHFVFDTRDLSTVRGGSLMLLDAVREVESCLTAGKSLVRTLSRGASAGLFELATHDPAAVAKAVRQHLARAFPTATFVVDVTAATSSFRDDLETLLGANRLRQMRSSSLAVPPANTAARTPAACALDGLHPAGQNKARAGFAGEHSWRRHKYGRNRKQDFYQRETGLSNLPPFAGDFETIADGSRPLTGKLAVFYADGNRFGALQAKHCDTPARQMAWDKSIREKRAAFLRDFLRDEACKLEWRGTQDGDEKGEKCILFETLLWGGDEVMFVMPASLGWRFAAFFFEKMGGLDLAMAGEELPNLTLTHAASLVFCQHHAPIDRIKRLAKDQMADFAKSASRERDSLVVVALESFDHLGSDYSDAMRRRYRGLLPLENMILASRPGGSLGGHLRMIANNFARLRDSETFARSQLRGLVEDILRCPTPADAPQMAAFIQTKDGSGTPVWDPPRHFRKATKEEKALLHDALLPLFGGDPVTLWLQLEELRDYALT